MNQQGKRFVFTRIRSTAAKYDLIANIHVIDRQNKKHRKCQTVEKSTRII